MINMSLIEFFHLQGLTGMSIINVLLILGIFLIILIIWLLWRYRIVQRIRAAGITWECYIPFFGRREARTILNKQNEAAKPNNYTPPEMTTEEKRRKFMDFIMDLPEYSITDGAISAHIRSILESGGARFQQVVLHDDGDNEDVEVWIQKKGDYFIHDKGVYFWPWSNAKNVLHWDIQDCRPLSDRSKEAQWQNPLMNARYFWGALNSNAMLRDDEGRKQDLLLLMVGIAIILSAAAIYLEYNNHKELLPLLQTIANNTKP